MSQNKKKEDVEKQIIKSNEIKKNDAIKQEDKSKKTSNFEFSEKTSRKDTSTVDLLAQILKDKANKEKSK